MNSSVHSFDLVVLLPAIPFDSLNFGEFYCEQQKVECPFPFVQQKVPTRPSSPETKRAHTNCLPEKHFSAIKKFSASTFLIPKFTSSSRHQRMENVERTENIVIGEGKQRTLIISRGNNANKAVPLGLVLLLILAIVQPARPRAISEDGDGDSGNDLSEVSQSTKNVNAAISSAQQGEQQTEDRGDAAAEASADDSCDVHRSGPVHALVDRICELCHDMFSHEQPNMRADCRSNCFRSNTFKKCLRLFKPAHRQQQQRQKRRLVRHTLLDSETS